MKILGNRILVEKLEEEKKEGFQVVEVQDNFVYKGRIVQLGGKCIPDEMPFSMKPGDIVLFAKYSPDIHEVEHEGKKYKIIKVDDILAII